MPDFTDDVEITFEAAHADLKLTAEIVADLVCNIQSKRINIIFLYPELTGIDKILAYLRIICIELWHIVAVSKGKEFTFICIVTRLSWEVPVIYHVPVCIF